MDNSILAKFRHGGTQNLTELEIMFNKIVASSTTAWNPDSIDETAVEVDDNLEQVDINLDDLVIETGTQNRSEDSEEIQCRTKRKGKKPEKVKKSKVGTARLMEQELKRMVDAMESFQHLVPHYLQDGPTFLVVAFKNV